jgi:ribose/xylose/arabinose/galactoside ABC-type transport system permease subunit
MVRVKVPSTRLLVVFVSALVIAFVLTQSRLTPAQPATGASPELKTIAHIVVHAHHHSPAQLNKGS